MQSIVVFSVNNERYAVPTTEVREALPVPHITALPGAARHLSGITNVRGRVVPVVDLRRRLGFPSLAPGEFSRIVLVELDGEEAGLLADSVLGVVDMGELTAGEPPTDADGTGMVRELFRRDTDIIMMLDLAAVLGTARGSKEGGV